MRLTPRLSAIAAMVPGGSVVADIGTDHGYIPVFLIAGGKVRRAVASDVKIGPLDKARGVIRRHGLEDRIETRLGNGLEVLKPGEVDTIVIAGMGGMLIKDLLEAGRSALEGIKRLVLQPMNAQEVVREWLSRNGYEICDETLAREKERVYQIIAAMPGERPIEDPFYFEIGKALIEKRHPLLPFLLEKKEKEYKKIIAGLNRAEQAGTAERLREYTRRLARLRGVMEQCSKWST
ncbi:MAG: tRNA (adenine(22)-N(1))-methyltransferase [Clostridia bacterium]|jgi:tRNA (adenine22-N1)-methyltransferase|nr:SAM-dependent methyltransferase [Clostridiales bacterium]